MPEQLPAPYAGWVASLVQGEIPSETKATCATCPMLPPSGLSTGDRYFDPTTKCCTYVPGLPNFLIGQILADPDESELARAGRSSVCRRIGNHALVTPLGLRSASRAGGDTASDNRFGRDPLARCPHFVPDSGTCGIWNHRDAVCSTWFCKHVRGATGVRFWQALRELLGRVEVALARWCVLEAPPSSQALEELLVIDAGTSIDEARYRRIWGDYVGNEAAYFRACGARVSVLRWEDVLAIGGAEALAYSKVARDRYAALLDERLPGTLRPGRLRELRVLDDRCVATTYSRHDPLAFPLELLTVLPQFARAPTLTEALDEIRVSEGIELTPELILRLVDFEVLVEPDD